MKQVHCQNLQPSYHKLITGPPAPPITTSTRRGSGEGVRPRWTHVDGERESSPMWTSTQKIKIRVHWRHPVFFSCKEVDIFFTRISSLDGIKSGNSQISAIHVGPEGQWLIVPSKVLREQCVFHVGRMYDVHKGKGSTRSCGRMWTGEGESKTWFFVDGP